jgi:hypothetical protein
MLMKVIISLAFFIVFSNTNNCRGNTALNNEQREFLMVQSAILQFQKDTNNFPTSWDDLWGNMASQPSVEWLDQGKSFGRRTDMIESFRFIAPGTTIFLPGDGVRVVGMMTRPMRPPPQRKLRLLVVQLKDGTRGSKQVPEEVLQKMFSRAGFDLADYTGANGNWAPETRLRPLSELVAPPKRALSNPSSDYSTIPNRPDKIRPDTSNNTIDATAEKSALFLWWILASSSALLVMALVAWLRLRKSRSTH